MRLSIHGWKVAVQGKRPGQADCNQKPVGYSQCAPWTSMVSLTQELPRSTLEFDELGHLAA